MARTARAALTKSATCRVYGYTILKNVLAERFVEGYGLSLAETARQLGVSTSAVARMMQRDYNSKCTLQLYIGMHGAASSALSGVRIGIQVGFSITAVVQGYSELTCCTGVQELRACRFCSKLNIGYGRHVPPYMAGEGYSLSLFGCV